MPPIFRASYTPPAVRDGDVVTCLARGPGCVVVGTSAAPPWPVVRGRRGRHSLWVTDELARSVRTESPAALIHWFGVSLAATTAWRRLLGVRRPPGRKRTGRERTSAINARAESVGVPGRKLWRANGWTPEEVALPGTDHDEAVAAKLGRTVHAVRARRAYLRIAVHHDRRGEAGRAWLQAAAPGPTY